MDTLNAKILFVGAGNMAGAIIRGALDAGTLHESDIAVLDPNEDKRASFANSFAEPASAIGFIKDTHSPVIVLAVKPQMLESACTPLRDHIAKLRNSPLVVSILAGTRSDTVRAAMGGRVRVVRVMPNTPAQIRKGMSAIAPHESATDADTLLVKRLFESVGDAVELDESMIDAFTAVAGSGPAYLFYLTESMTNAAIALGFDDDTARRIVEQTITGSAALLEASDDDAQTLRAKVTSKHGTTHAATTTLDDHQVMEIVIKALTAARDRGIELGS
jgi:pyrroline-5-carboxylate reductase